MPLAFQVGVSLPERIPATSGYIFSDVPIDQIISDDLIDQSLVAI